MKTHKIRLGTLLLGLVTVAAVILSQLFCFSPSGTAADTKKASTTQGDDSSSSSEEPGSHLYISLPSFTNLPAALHLEFQQESFCLFEILFEEQKPGTYTNDVPIPLNKFFKTLFSAIISPNAP